MRHLILFFYLFGTLSSSSLSPVHRARDRGRRERVGHDGAGGAAVVAAGSESVNEPRAG
jgi:hypothetical protein